MKLFLLLSIFTVINLSAPNYTAPEEKVKCPCPEEIKDECIPQKYCVYGINDAGNIFHNGINDAMNLTNIALQRKAEINNFDDVIVNLYTPYLKIMAIFYYGCRKCDDLKQVVGNVTVSKVRIFLLSLYNQRMKYNIKYSQSDFQYFSNISNELQPMPEITVRPFWKNRLMYNQTCARKQLGFTQKHFIPAFLTQDFCILDYKYIGHKNATLINNIYHTNDGQIIYSLTLSYIDLYQFSVVSNSISDFPSEFEKSQGMCKVAFDLEVFQQKMRFFCLCNQYSCTLKVAQKNPWHFCASKLGIALDNTVVNPGIHKSSDFITITDFFMEDPDISCFFAWRTSFSGGYEAFIRSVNDDTLPEGYTFKLTNYTNINNLNWFCPFNSYSKTDLQFIRAKYFKRDPMSLRNAFLGAIMDHSMLYGDTIFPVGANCSMEGPLSDSFFSSRYGATTSEFPCYQYYEIVQRQQLFPMMGLNVIPISIAKGKECYYYTIKMGEKDARTCASLPKPIAYASVMTIAACPENVKYDEEEFDRMLNISSACPTMNPGESKWEYISTIQGNGILCGQFLRGLKLQNGIYVPEEIELRVTNRDDFEMTGMTEERVEHGCGFNATQNLTFCTCYAALGGCEDLYTVGRVHLLRYLPFYESNATYYN